ncbi:pyruvate ferredoxin oxidoreductase [Patescibacteria group bacterium]|nr:pyruvate ferredoxin oxidoreductase [Patescibacteria group bacterium]
MNKCIEGSHAVAETINLCRPKVIAAYPITPQTHIVEDLAKMKANGDGGYEFVRCESEFAAASIILGASASGVRVYSASSSQGLLLMTEVLFTIAGMRLPAVLTCANRAISAPINIWNDQQDAMTLRDSGWIMLFAEDNQEAVDLHIVAYKITEALRIPVMVNMDGFVLTHTFEPVDIPEQKEVDAFLPEYSPEQGQFLDINMPVSLGCFATPADYMNIREELAIDIEASKKFIKTQLGNYKKAFGRGGNALVEYYGAKNPDVIIVAMGSVVGTIKDAADELMEKKKNVGLAKIKCLRPFPKEELVKVLGKTKFAAVLDKSISLGQEGILATEVKAAAQNKLSAKIQSFVVGLGGRDITKDSIKEIFQHVQKRDSGLSFVE